MSKILSFFKIFSKIFSGGGNWIFGVLMIISMFSKKKKQETTTNSVASNYQSPTYSWDNISNTSEVDAPLPIVFGTHKVGGNIINTHIITNITKQNKIVTKKVEPHLLTYDQTNKRISGFLDTGGIAQLDLVVGVQNYGSLPQDKEVNVEIVVKQHSNGTVWYRQNHIFVGQGNANAPFAAFQNRSSVTFTATVKNLDKNYTDGYDIELNYIPIARVGSCGCSVLKAAKYFGTVLPISYNKMEGVITLGSTNEYSAQTLQMDVGLSIGQIKDVKSITVNDQPVSGYISADKYGQNEIRIGFDWKCGHDFLIEENLNKTIAGQSAVFNQNKVVSRLWAVLITQPAPIGAMTIYVADNGIFTKPDGTFNNLVIGSESHAIASLEDNDKVHLAVPNRYNVPEAGKYWAHVASDDVTIINTGKFTDFDYVTQFDYVDGLDLALVCPNGLYLVNNETGAYIEHKITYHVYIAHNEIWDDNLPHDITDPAVNFYSQPITVTGNRRGKIWYNYQIDSLPTSTTGKKKYRIKVRKVSRDSIDSSLNMNDLNIAYVEEIKNKDLYYNGLGYATLNMPADPRLNGGNPSFAFIIDGVRVPKLLHDSLKITSISNDNSVIHIAKDPITASAPNAYLETTPYEINTPFLFISGWGRLAVSEEYGDIFTHGDYVSRKGNYRFSNIVTCLFKCGNTWHKRYCLFGNTYEDGQSNDPTKHLGRIVILTYANVLAMIADPLVYFDGLQYSGHADDLLKIKDYMDADPYLKEYNTGLPSQPTDMVTYTWSNNPANAILYLLTDENGLNIPLQYIDIDSFREAEAYFNEPVDDLLNLGRTMPRCRLNFVIDTISNIRNHIDKICTTCHSSLLESDGKIKLKVDKQGTFEYFIDEDKHILPDSFKVISLPDKDLPNQINITFLNEVKDYAKEIITIEDISIIKQYGESHVRKLDMDLYGVTAASQVYREGLLLLKQAKFIHYTIAFKTSVAGFPLEVGTIFKLRSTSHGFGDPNDPTDGRLFRVMNIKYDEKQECEVTAIEYFDTIYDITNEDKLSFPVVNHSDLPNPSKKPEAVKNLTITEYNEQSNSGDIITSVVGTFQTPDRPSYKNNNMTAFLGVDASLGATTLTLRTLEEIKRLTLGDRLGINTFVSDANIQTLEQLIPIANMIPNSPAMKAQVDAAQADIDAIYDTLTPYTIQSIDYANGLITISPALTQAYLKDSFLTTISYSAASKYEFSKYSHVVSSLIKVNDDGTHTVLFDKEKFEGTVVKFATPELGKYFIAVYAVSANGMVGDPVVSDTITLVGKSVLPPTIPDAIVEQYNHKHVWRVSWSALDAKDIKTYQVEIIPKFADPVVEPVVKKIIYPFEYIHTFSVSGEYDVKIRAINTSDKLSAEFIKTINVVVEITEDFNTPHYTLRGNVIQLSWNALNILAELPRYEIYLNNEPFTLENPLLPFDPVTNKYLGLTSSLLAWEGTSTQIPISNLPETGAPLSFDEAYYIVLVAKYKHNGVERKRQTQVLIVPSLADTAPIIALYSTVPPLENGNLIAANHFKPQVIAVPDSGVTMVWGRIYKVGEVAPPQTGFIRFTKVDGLWEYDFTSLVDGEYQVEIVGATDAGDDTNTITQIIVIDTSIPVPLPRPIITKDNTYVQTLLISYNAQTTTPLNGGDTIDIFNSKTIQITLAPFTTCANFSHIKVYVGEYNKSTKTYGLYNEYKIPQAVGLPSNTLITNFKASITFNDDMPDFRLKCVMVKKNGIEGSLAMALASVRNKIDTTPPLIKVESLTYDEDESNFNAINNNYINAKLNGGLGLLLNLNITETNSGLWSNAMDVAAGRIPIAYQINRGNKVPMYQKGTTRFYNPYLIPKEAFAGIAEGEKVTITIYALDNALKLGSYVMTKILDTVAPNNVTQAKAVFGVEANQGVIKLQWTNPSNSDLAGIRIYEGATLVKETTGRSTSIPTTTGTTRTFVIKAYDYANNESTGVTLEAINYPPKQVTGLLASSDSSSISLTWDEVTEDTNNDIMTDLKHYKVSFYNPATSQTVIGYTTDTHYVIPMTANDMKYFSAYPNAKVTDIKIKAIDFFGAEGAYSTATEARPRFVEAVDMTGNMFKFVPLITGSYTGNTEHIVDANYHNAEYITMSNPAQGHGIKLDMKPAYIAETKVKFVGGIVGSTYARFIIHYRVQNPTTLEESDAYLASTTHGIDNLYETASLSEALTNYIQVSITNNKPANEKDSENCYSLSLIKPNLSRKNFYCKYVELLFASGNPSSLGISEVQPRIRSIANEFYGESLLLSTMLSIRSTEDTANYVEMDKLALRVYGSSALKVKVGYINEQGVYGAWFKDNVYIGGSSPANAPIRFEGSPSLSVGGLTANNSVASITGTNNFSNTNGLDTAQLKGNATSATVGSNTNSQITTNGSTTDVKQVSDVGWAQFTQDYLAFGVSTYGTNVKAKFGKLNTGLYGIWMTDGVYIGGTSYANAAMRLTAAANGTIQIGYITTDTYNVSITGTGMNIGYDAGQAKYQTVISADYIRLGLLSTGYHNILIDNAASTIKLGHIGTTAYNTYISGSYTGIGYTGGYYNTKIESSLIQLGHISSGTTYALTMNFSGSESTRYFSIKGTDLSEYFRIGYFTWSSYTKRAVWAKRLYLSNNYNDDNSDVGAGAYFYTRMTENQIAHFIFLPSQVTTGRGIYIYSDSANCILAEIESGNNNAIRGEAADGAGVSGWSSMGVGIDGFGNNNYGGYFNSNWTYSLASVKQSYLNGQVTCGSSLYVTTWASFQSTIFAPNIGAGSDTSPGVVLEGGYLKVASSSIRYKENIQPLAVNRVLELTPKSFTWKTTKKDDIGLVAEEVNEIIPELVGWYKGQIQTVDYAKLSVLLLDIVKKQQKDIDTLKNLVDNLIKQ